MQQRRLVKLQVLRRLDRRFAVLRALAHSFAPDRGYGSANRGRYANPALDALIEQASATIDDDRRRTLLQEAGRMVVDDVPFIPVHFELSTWAARKPLRYAARVDQYTLAMGTRA
jgi:peptide/nickel transport system substrate-binding protein